MSEHKALGGRVLTVPFLVLGLIAALGMYFLAQRFLFGLGAVSNLNDGYTWGIWVVYDVVVGTGLATGGYALAILIYVFNRGEYHPLIRPALLASLFGYSLGAFSAFFDMGRYWNAYQVFLPWNMNFSSVMLEVALCVTAYTLVLVIEFSPAAFERLRNPRMQQRLNKILFLIIGLGIVLPTMHQSSLGGLLIAMGHKVAPLWQTNILPLLFLISALAMGLSIVVFEAALSARGFRRPLETPLLAKLSRVIVGLLGVYLLVRFADLIYRGALGDAFAGDLNGNMFLLETALYAIPLLVLVSAANRARPPLLFLAAVSMLLAGAVYRFNAFLIGFDPGPGFHYFPSVPEISISLGIIALEVMGYLYVVKRLPVLHRLQPA